MKVAECKIVKLQKEEKSEFMKKIVALRTFQIKQTLIPIFCVCSEWFTTLIPKVSNLYDKKLVDTYFGTRVFVSWKNY